MRKAILAVAVLLSAGFLYMNRDWPRYWRLAKTGIGTEGWVLGKADGKVHYAYGGPVKIHTASGEAGYGNPEYGVLAEGDKVVVYFLPQNPDESVMGEPSQRLLRQHTIMVWTLLLAGPLIYLALRRELSRQAT